VRAYGAAAAAVLETAPVVARPVRATFSLTHDYDLSGVVESVLAALDASLLGSDYGGRVALRVAVPAAGAEAFAASLREGTSGRVVPEATTRR
jgi:putative IMPACT (imprinted ancient) family translation regulator